MQIRPSNKIVDDLSGIASYDELGASEKRQLTSVVVGAVPGNRDRPLFLLVRSIRDCVVNIHGKKENIIFKLLIKDGVSSSKNLRRGDVALLDFLASMDSYRYFEEISGAIDSLAKLPNDTMATKECTSVFSKCLYRYRVDHLPAERHRMQFNDIRKFYVARGSVDSTPVDGDALEFWSQEADRSRWTRYETVLLALVAFAESLELSDAIGAIASLDDEQARLDPSDEHSIDYGSLNEILQNTVAALANSSLKIFKQTEIDDLERFARLGRFAASWPRSSWAWMAFGPFQASLVQIERQGSGTNGIKTASCQDGDTYVEIVSRFARHLKTATDCLTLAEAVSDEFSRKNGASVSMTNVDAPSDVKGLLRRKSFSSLSPVEIHRELEELYSSIAELKAGLNYLVRVWDRRIDRKLAIWFFDDQRRFAMKLADLYL